MQAVRGVRGVRGAGAQVTRRVTQMRLLHSDTDSRELVLIRLNTDHRISQLIGGSALLASPTLPVLGRKWSWGPSGTAAAAEQGPGAPVQLCPRAQGNPALQGGSRSRGREAAATYTEICQ